MQRGESAATPLYLALYVRSTLLKLNDSTFINTTVVTQVYLRTVSHGPGFTMWLPRLATDAIGCQ
jgi:hypothetical protein